MKGLMRSVLVACMVAALGLGVAAAQELNAPKKPRKGKTIEWAKNYLLEIKKHLKKSYVLSEQVSDEQLLSACQQGLAQALDAEPHKLLDNESRDALRGLFQARYEKISGVVAALETYLADGPVEGLRIDVLADAAAKAMVASVKDPYSHVFTQKEVQKMMGMMSGESREDSPGFSVAPKGGRFEIGYVMYGYPAARAGLRMGDEVLALNGQELRGMDLAKLGDLLKLKAGDQLEVTVRRKGWSKPYSFTVVQRGEKPKDVIATVLPGDIGYLRLTIFDMTLESAVQKAMKHLADQGIQSLILDLRQNPGGALNAAVGVADQFIAGKKLITKTESNYKIELPIKLPGLLPEMAQEFFAGKRSPYENLPMVVLIDHTSASASELLSGALQDTGRAVILGATSYGKGVGQTVIPLWRTGFPMPERYLYLTVMTYTLPTGRSIHGSGVVPNVAIEAKEPTAEEFDRIYALRQDSRLADYAAGILEESPERARELARYDGFETSRYPGFAAFHRRLKSGLSEQQVREEVRRVLREQIEDESKQAWVVDLETDVQLQAAVLHLADGADANDEEAGK